MRFMLSYILLRIGYEYWKLGIWKFLDLCMVPTPWVEISARANIYRPPNSNKDWMVRNIRLGSIIRIGCITLPVHGD